MYAQMVRTDGTGVKSAAEMSDEERADWLTQKIGMKQEGHEENLVRALTRNCSLYRNRDDFDTIVCEIREALGVWKGGRFLKDFAPQFIEPQAVRAATPFTGTNAKGMLYFPDNTAGIKTPGDLFALMSAMICRAEDIPVDAAALWDAGIALGRDTAAA